MDTAQNQAAQAWRCSADSSPDVEGRRVVHDGFKHGAIPAKNFEAPHADLSGVGSPLEGWIVVDTSPAFEVAHSEAQGWGPNSLLLCQPAWRPH